MVTSMENVETLREILAAFNDNDPERAANLFAQT
jgi:hypothetical protein